VEPVYRIAKWDKVFENAESRRITNLSWVAWPIRLDSAGYYSLIDEFGPEAPAIYGAWCALVCVAATLPERGTLADSKGRPYSVGRVAMMTHMPVECFEKLVAWASTEDVAWLEVVDAQRSPIDRPADSQPTGDERRREETRGDPPPIRRLSAATEIVIDDDRMAELLPLIERVARVVTKRSDVIVSRLAAGDRRLCFKSAALAIHRYGPDWLDEILEKLSNRKKKLDNEWGYYRKALIGSVREQFGEEFRDAEKLVINRAGTKAEATA
jgi:hypothetical protein